MDQNVPLELESFSSKVKIVEQKLGVAMKEYEVDVCKPEEKNSKVPVLCEENFAATGEEKVLNVCVQ
jgi:hypothetical protein